MDRRKRRKWARRADRAGDATECGCCLADLGCGATAVLTLTVVVWRRTRR